MSFKLGLLFFIFIVLIESILFFVLYYGLISERVQYETNNILSRGNSHRDVLEKKFDSITREHVALMESETETMTIITDTNHAILSNSNDVTSGMEKIIEDSKRLEISYDGMIIERRWKSRPYISTVSPIVINGENEGYVFMFYKATKIRDLIEKVTSQFLLVGAMSLVLTVVTTYFLSRFITTPLVKMKHATERLSKGRYEMALDIYREDELGELARSIQTLSDDLERMKRERNDFLSSISHELRTPLTYLKGYADVAKRQGLGRDERNEYLSIIQDEAGKMTTLVKDLFDLAKMDQHSFPIQKEALFICDFINVIIQNMKHAYAEKGVNLHFQCKCDDWELEIDPQRFRQVMINLLDNALKHTAPEKSVTVAVERENGDLRIMVNDEGAGIPKQDLPYIWDRLYRVEKSRSRATGGSGLGLTIAKEIVEMHHGTIDVVSEVGKGTTFTILIRG